MKIESVRAIPLRLPLVNDSVDGTQDDLLIRIETDEGVAGYGEVESSRAWLRLSWTQACRTGSATDWAIF